VAKADAKVRTTQNAFSDKYEAMRIKAQIPQERAKLLEKLAKEKDSKEIEGINDELKKLDKKDKKIGDKADKEADLLVDGKWRKLSLAKRDAALDNVLWGYWREWAFVVGSIVLSIGCLMVGFKGTGAERMVCLVVIAIITFSVYVAGAAWISSLTTTMK